MRSEAIFKIESFYGPIPTESEPFLELSFGRSPSDKASAWLIQEGIVERNRWTSTQLIFQKILQRFSSRGFTLVELLAVIAITATLAFLAVGSIPGIANSSSMNKAVGGIQSSLQEARTYAMANDTYVWVGFYTNLSQQNVTVGVVAGQTGAADDLAGGSYSAISKVSVYDYFSINSISGVPGVATGADDISSSQIGTFSERSAGATVNFTEVIQFSPQGVATVLPNSSSHWIQIGLQPLRGGSASTTDVAVFQVGALSGQVNVFRP